MRLKRPRPLVLLAVVLACTAAAAAAVTAAAALSTTSAATAAAAAAAAEGGGGERWIWGLGPDAATPQQQQQQQQDERGTSGETDASGGAWPDKPAVRRAVTTPPGPNAGSGSNEGGAAAAVVWLVGPGSDVDAGSEAAAAGAAFSAVDGGGSGGGSAALGHNTSATNSSGVVLAAYPEQLPLDGQQEQQQQLTQAARQAEQGAVAPRPPPPPPRPVPSPPLLLQEPDAQGTEYLMERPSAAALAGSSSDSSSSGSSVSGGVGRAGLRTIVARRGPARRRRGLLQQAPSLCGKLGTLVPNFYSRTDGSMFGVAVASNQDGSILGVGSPINGADAAQSGGASILTSWSDKTCEYAVTPVQRPEGCYKYFGAQVALSTDGRTFVVADGVEGIKTATAEGNRPVVHVYRRYTNGSFLHFQKLNVAPRRAMASAMAVSTTDNGQTILVSFSVGEGFPDKRGSAQVFVLDGTKPDGAYFYLQDLANLNMPAGTSVNFGATSAISANGAFIAVGTAAATNSYFNLAYMYKKDAETGRFRIVSTISSGEAFPDPWAALAGVGVSDTNSVAITQSGRFVLRVENAQLVIYEWSGTGMSVTWRRRCQISAPSGYVFRTTAGATSIVETSPGRVKFAAGAYIGSLENPEQMAVFLYYLNAHADGTCPYRPAEKHVHADAYSNYGAGVAVTPDGALLAVGAPTAYDNNMDYQVGAVYLMDIDKVADDGLLARTVTVASNANAGCVNGVDPNGNPCVAKQRVDPICKDVKRPDGSVIHYGPEGCTPTPPPPSFWTSSIGGAGGGSGGGGGAPGGATPATFSTASVSAYTTIAPSIKGGVGVPVGSDAWLENQQRQRQRASYFGVPSPPAQPAKQSIVSAAGWPSSVQPALGGLSSSNLNTVGAAAPAPPGVSVLSVLSNVGSNLLGRIGGGGGGALGGGGGLGGIVGPGGAQPVPGLAAKPGSLPAGAVITNAAVLSGGGGGRRRRAE